MREIVFNKYWQLVALPITIDLAGLSEDEVDGRSDIYQCMLALMNACKAAW